MADSTASLATNVEGLSMRRSPPTHRGHRHGRSQDRCGGGQEGTEGRTLYEVDCDQDDVDHLPLVVRSARILLAEGVVRGGRDNAPAGSDLIFQLHYTAEGKAALPVLRQYSSAAKSVGTARNREIRLLRIGLRLRPQFWSAGLQLSMPQSADASPRSPAPETLET